MNFFQDEKMERTRTRNISGNESTIMQKSSDVSEDDDNIEEEDDDEEEEETHESLNTFPRPPKYPNVQIEDLTICPVCTEKATKDKHRLHYGGTCCYSCRAFFRRAHQTTKYPNFRCLQSFNEENETYEHRPCGSSVKLRRQCQFCRYKRCIEIGMDSKWVLTSGQKKIRFRRHLKIKRLEKGINSKTNAQLSDKSTNTLDEDEKEKIFCPRSLKHYSCNSSSKMTDSIKFQNTASTSHERLTFNVQRNEDTIRCMQLLELKDVKISKLIQGPLLNKYPILQKQNPLIPTVLHSLREEKALPNNSSDLTQQVPPSIPKPRTEQSVQQNIQSTVRTLHKRVFI